MFGVYRHAYRARLAEVLRGAFPLLAQYMGDEAFAVLAARYVADYPSHHANARWYASSLPNLLGMVPWNDEQPVLKELATIEWELDLAFDAADAPVLDLAALASLPPEAWAHVSFIPHPSASLLSFATNAFEVWLALKNETEIPRPELFDEPRHFLIWRQDNVPKIRTLGAEEYMLWVEAARGKPFGGLAEMAATYDDPGSAAVRVAQYFQGWLSAGLLSEAVT